MKYVLLALLLAAATPAFAGDDFPYPTLSNELDADGLENAPQIDPSPDFNGTVDLVGGLNLALDRAPMSAVTESFDVGPQTYQHVGYTTTWACFTDAGRRVWYIADQTYETRDDVYVGTIIDEPSDPVTDALFLCKPEPKAMLEKNPALPAIGTTLAKLNTFYKVTIPEGTRYLVGYGESSQGSISVHYRLTDGIVDAMSVAGSSMDADND